MSKHTKGPWLFEGDEIRTASGRRQKDIARVMDPGFSDSGTRSSGYPAKEANGRLIAAAPEMLALIYDLIREDCDEDEDCLHCRIVAVLAKVEGSGS